MASKKEVTHTNSRQCIAAVGRQQVGKSSLMTEFGNSYLKRGGLVRYYSPHPRQFGKLGLMCNRSNINTIIGEPGDDTKENPGTGLCSGEFQGATLFDDCDTYLGPQSSDAITTWCSTFRHYDCDLFFSSRAIQQIDIAARRCFTKVCVFQMQEPRALKLLAETVAEVGKLKVPRDPFEYYCYDLQEYTVELMYTKPMATKPK